MINNTSSGPLQYEGSGDFISNSTALVAGQQRQREGGIDFNSVNMAMTIKRDGHGVPLPWAQQDMAKLNNLKGLEPIILSIQPATQSAVYSNLR